MITIHRGIYYSCKLYNSYNICILCNAQQQLSTIHFWQKENLTVRLDVSSVENRRTRERLSVLRVTRRMYNDVWQRGDSSNAPIRKIFFFFRTNYVENKIKNKLSHSKNKTQQIICVRLCSIDVCKSISWLRLMC